MGDDLARILRQQAQQIEFLRRQVNLVFAALDLVPRDIDLQIAGLDQRRRTLLPQPVPQGGAQPRQQFADAERLI